MCVCVHASVCLIICMSRFKVEQLIIESKQQNEKTHNYQIRLWKTRRKEIEQNLLKAP